MALSDRAETVNLHSSQRDTTIAGICFPCLAFTALHTGWHAHEHFLKEKIRLRHMIDWAVALRQLSGEDAEAVNAVKSNTLWDRLLYAMAAIALHRLGLPREWFLQQDVGQLMPLHLIRNRKCGTTSWPLHVLPSA